MVKNRIIEDAGGGYLPQFKQGIFSRWRLYARDADTSKIMLLGFIAEDDPGRAARFDTADDALSFVSRVMDNAEQHWRDVREASLRKMSGVRIKRKIPVRQANQPRSEHS